MKSLLKSELRRAFKSRGMLFSLLCGTAISILQIIQVILPNVMHQQTQELHIIQSLFYFWIGGATYSWHPFCYFILLPLLVAIPYSITYYNDYSGGWNKNIYMRMERKSFLRIKSIVGFLSGSFVAIVPLVINFMIGALILPMSIPQELDSLTLVGTTSFAYELFYSRPILYVLLYLFIIAIFGGLVAVFVFAMGYVFQSKIIVLLSPFAIGVFVYSLLNIFDLTDYAPALFLNPGSSNNNIWEFLISYISMIGILYILFYRKGIKEDVF